MPTSNIIQPYLNPVKFHKMTPDQIPQYLSRFKDDWAFRETIKEWEEPVLYCSYWIRDDSIHLQFISNYDPLTLKLFTDDNVEQHSQVFDIMQADYFRPGHYIKQVELDLTPFPAGCKYLQINCGEPVAMALVSEPIHLYESDDIRVIDTSLIQYSHYEPYGDIIFSSPFEPSIRVPSWNKYKEPGSKDVMYIDQSYNNQMVKSIPFDVYNFILGGDTGVPPWLIQKMNWIFGCSELKIDGRLWAKAAEGAKWDEIKVDGRPMSGWQMDLVLKINKASIMYENEVEIIGMSSMMAVTDTKGFGLNDNSGNDFQEIVDVN